MNEKIMERLNRKMVALTQTTTQCLLSYRYGELVGILDTMRELGVLKHNEYTSLLKTIDVIYDVQNNKITGDFLKETEMLAK